MQMRILPVVALASMLFLTAVSAVDVSSSGPEDSYQRGDSFTVTTTFTFDCTDQGASAADFTATIVNLDDYPFINASEEAVSYDPNGCIGTTPLSYTAPDVDINVTVGDLAPAFEIIDLQPGLVGETNNDGNFSFTVEYDPAFNAPTALEFDSVADGVAATIPLTVTANAASTFQFEVIDITDGFTGHIEDTLDVDSPLSGENNGSLSTSVELHFSVPSEESDHAGHGEGGDADHADHADGSSEDTGGHHHWETAEAVVHITLAAQEDLDQTSEAHEVVITFVNTDPETLPHTEDEEEDDEDGFFKSLPGFELLAAVAIVGAVAALRRRD